MKFLLCSVHDYPSTTNDQIFSHECRTIESGPLTYPPQDLGSDSLEPQEFLEVDS